MRTRAIDGKRLPTEEPRFPMNLLEALGMIENDPDDPFEFANTPNTVTVLAAMEAARLTDREANILDMRFRQGMTLEEVGGVYSLTRDRIRQIESKALRKLRWGGGVSRKILEKGFYAWANERISEKARAMAEAQIEKFKAEWIEAHPEPENAEAPKLSDDERAALEAKAKLDMTIEDLDLSVRSYNCLKRANINTVRDLTERTRDSMIYVRNLGRKSLEEVGQKLKLLGLDFAPEPIAHAMWIPVAKQEDVYMCSNCGARQWLGGAYEKRLYCMGVNGCGAKMDGIAGRETA
ncbi:MAG: hypothetical protein IKP40_13970 [Clostridia bacterium]|nr:hypothetical protein [Clostridia bacterium]